MLAARLTAEPPWVLELVRSLARCAPEGAFARHGVPTGSALCNPLVNVYLTDLDAMLAQSACFSARYGDDVVAVFEARDQAEMALSHTLALIARKELSLRPAKLERIYWTGSGRQPQHADWRPARHVTMCGIDVGFDGTRRVKTGRRRDFLQDLLARLRALVPLLGTRAPLERAAGLCAAASNLLDRGSPTRAPELDGILAATDCRIQIREMDRVIALGIAGLATGKKGPRAFRTVPWRTLHALGLPSLTRLRNR
jgi:hypothetical protein